MKVQLFGSAMLAAVLAVSSAAVAQVREIAKSDAPGPTVLVVTETVDGEISAEVAVKQVSAWGLLKGRVVTAKKQDGEAAVREVKPSAVVMLEIGSRGAKQTIGGRGIEVAPLIPTLNEGVEEKDDHLSVAERVRLPAGADRGVEVVLTRPLTGSAATRAATREGAAVAAGMTPAGRTRVFRQAVWEVLAAEGMVERKPASGLGAWKLVNEKHTGIRVALYAGAGSDRTTGVVEYPRSMAKDATLDWTYVGNQELARPDVLKQFDVVIFCGGGGGGQARAIGEEGAKNVKEFVKAGGGYVSSCAGTYLATSGYAWSLRMLAADAIDTRHWMRGVGDVQIELTEEGRKILGDYKGLVTVKYANGPLLGIAKKPEEGVAPFIPLAYFRSDMAKNGVPGGVMPNTPAMVAGEYGKGRVISFSPHPEYVEGLEGMVTRAVRWSARRPLE